MRNSTILLMALALALALIPRLEQTVVATPALGLRRSRFLANDDSYDCSKPKSPSVCLSSGSPGATCCQGRCVDTDNSLKHCGKCNTTCPYAQTCCKGKCVDTSTDDKNCGGCGAKCKTKCTKGSCGYAA